MTLLVACRQEETRPRPETSQTRAPTPNAGQAAGATAGGAPAALPDSVGQGGGKPGAEGTGRGAGTPARLPPSERGAVVEITETPAGAAPPDRASANAATSQRGEGDEDKGGTGGNVPHQIAADARQGVGGGMPPQGNQGKTQGGKVPAQQGVPLSSGVATAPGPATGTLDEQLGEFRRAMQRAQSAAEAERAGSPLGREEGRGGRLTPATGFGGAGGAADQATGLGASPDLTGETSGTPHSGGPSAVQAQVEVDETIIARQLREAAEQEKDPVLREKLWMEYRNYTRP